jgi:hypothetical protein
MMMTLKFKKENGKQLDQENELISVRSDGLKIVPKTIIKQYDTRLSSKDLTERLYQYFESFVK